jgi:ubiquinone/menaquinone biosynthesis C-methylase UbiE
VFVSPEKVIEDLDLRPGMAVADFGCGSGHYSVAAAKRVGKNGKVYALDIQKEMLEMVRAQAKLEHLDNIETIWTDLETQESSRFKENSVDLVIISNILFQAENKKQIIEEAYRIIKPGGKAVVIEWDRKEKKIGPPLEARISPQEAKKMFEEADFSFEKEFNPGENHYGFIFRKK